MAGCIYCGVDAYNVIEVRYARTIGSASMANVPDEENSPREIVGRGYPVCDGCVALLDFRVEHHLDRRKHSVFNALSALYQLLVMWGVVAISSLAGQMLLIRNRAFLMLGLVFAFGALVVWFLRAKVHADYYRAWRKARNKPFRPAHGLTAMTDLRDRMNPELAAYLPVRYDHSLKLAALPGSPPVRSLGPGGEPWGQGPPTNFPGSGDAGFYRLVWISWRLWPLTNVVEPESADWQPPEGPFVTEVEVAAATLLGSGTFTALLFVGQLPLWLPVAAGFVMLPVGWFLGLRARELMEQRRFDKATHRD